ncbi:MAG TPA: MerR family transcriptional regulator [Firmicutes bacterium]|nr:MerR family transcriptional regulator [Bacillota bacterium]
MLRNCADCNQIFAHPVNKLCPSCTKKQNEMFDKVKEYIRTNPKAKIHEVVVQTGVDFDKVREFIDEGRLKIVPADVEFRCRICGTKLTSGRICSQCEADLLVKGETRGGTTSTGSLSKDGRVHFLDRRSRESR